MQQLFSAVFHASKRPHLSALVHILTLKNGPVLTETWSPFLLLHDTNYPTAQKCGARFQRSLAH